MPRREQTQLVRRVRAGETAGRDGGQAQSGLQQTMKDTNVRDRLLGQGAEPHFGPPEDLRRYLANEIAVWGKLIRELELQAD